MNNPVRILVAATLYIAASLGANLAAAGPVDVAALAALREGSMMKLRFLDAPQPAADVPFTDAEGREHRLSEYRGKVVLLNFWATWCAPCRKEMPQLAALQDELGGDDFQVLTIAAGRNPVPAVEEFFDEIGVTNLPLMFDPRQKLAREMAVFGLPVTVILDREGNEIGRMQGDAEWHAPSAVAILKAVIAATAPQG